ncbi:MAG: hypothetical protein KC635_10065, partial [Myxococcales bacterium]|nr:hypothetical protein [Myxococcales bacterium]
LAESAASQGPVVVTSARRAVRETIPMIDVTTEQEIPVEVTIRDALETAPRLVRDRPWAYVLRPEARDLAERLRVLGLTVSELPAAVTATVETYRVTSYRRAPKAYEGMIRQTVKTRVEPRPVELPAGSFVVRMDQPRANLVGEVLEPETENGFVSFGVLATDKGEELPYYRAMTPLVGAGSEGN